MKVLVIGGGGREHAVVTALAKNKTIDKLYAAPGNGGIAALAECVDIKATDVEGVVRFSEENGIDFVVVTPDDPLMLGMVDALTAHGIKAFGPDKKAAIIEGSKVFSKRLMRKYGIPTADFEVFDDYDKAVAYVRQKGAPIVVKADGLALGKGVVVAQTEQEAIDALREIMCDRIFGDSGKEVLIEECLYGREISVLAFTDGETVVPMRSAQDHKRAYDGNKGPNTGGMGAISPSPVFTDELKKECMEKIFLPTVKAMKAEGRPFKGVLYFGLMMTENGVMVIEYNARFGDPEAQVVIPLLKTDLFEIMNAVADGKLDRISVEFSDEAAVCVVIASGGYPKKYEKGYEISGLGDVDCTVYHAGTALRDGKTVTAGGRVLDVTALGKTLEEARQKVYSEVGKISFRDSFYRTDIGKV